MALKTTRSTTVEAEEEARASRTTRPATRVPPQSTGDEAKAAHRVIQIPDRRYFRIGEVADLLGVRPHVLRYWETEFDEIRPQKSQHNQRLYRRKDVEILVAIRKLLYEERFTIAGARERLKALIAGGEVERYAAPKVPLAALDLDRLETLRDGLQDLLALLDRREADLAALGADD